MNIQKTMSNFFLNACYAYCVAYMYGDTDDEYELTELVLKGLKKGYISQDGYVSAPHLFANMCMGKERFYSDVRIKPYKEEIFHQIVCFEYGKKTHFNVMRSGKIVWDPWPDSNTVKNGKPVSVREFI